ncbi:MAG TPA: polymer-forming cytoskeletal protein [Candidatus Polarisedimenticolaceae bacterium]|nr:polymer-forming cytoskeletal protein [Candidatus Polarisedimenticolaceae bacterium]
MTLRRSIALSALTVLLAFGAAFAVDPPDPPVPPDPPDRPRFHHGDGEPKVSIFNDVTVEKGERESGVVAVGGDVTIDGDIDGDVVAVMGDVTLNGTINGNLVAVMGDIELGDHAVLNGDVTNVGGKLDRGQAEIHGNVVNASPGMNIPGMNWLDWGGFGAAWLFPWWAILKLFLFFVAALVLAALVPDRIRLMSEETPVRLFTALLFGLLGYTLLAMTQVVLCVTIIGIPIAILVYFVFLILKWMAMCGIFHYVGGRLARSFGRQTSFLGAILLGLAPFALIRLLPFCIGSIVWFLVEIVAFGLLIITRLGTRPMSLAPVPAAAVMAPPPPPPPV